MAHEAHPQPHTQPPPQRRSFIAFLIFGIGGIFSAILGVPVTCYLLDPRNRKAPKSVMKLVEGVNVKEIGVGSPVQGVLRDRRVDGWTLYPSDVLGRVWVVKQKELPALTTKAAVEEFNKKPQAEKDAFILVFTTICPHLGCSINFAAPTFACPCHAATFSLKGDKLGAGNPAKRGMDTLDWELDVDDEPEFKRIKVEYKRFKTLEEQKEALA